LTWHKSLQKAVCHYCGYQEAPPEACPKCGSMEAGWMGFGTEMIEEEVKAVFPGLRVARVDADTSGVKDSLEKTLTAFRKGSIDVLLGTQMVAKGLNFPGVRLVGVILADSGLHLPDFRAAERTFALLVQVAGRAGRFFADGKVIVQSFRPNDPAIALACSLDIDNFYTAELASRKDLAFPPYSRLIHWTVRSKDQAAAQAAIDRLAAAISACLPAGADFLGPAECPIPVIAGNYRCHIIMRGASMASLHSAARAALTSYELQGKDAKVHLEVDVDPVSLL
jgi:primosomal protein N' (replication factor Y)